MSADIQYQSVTVDIPADRVAEFHLMFGHFLAGDIRRGRGPRGRHHRDHPGHGCGPRRAEAQREVGEAAEA